MRTTKIVSMLLALLMVVSLLPLSVLSIFATSQQDDSITAESWNYGSYSSSSDGVTISTGIQKLDGNKYVGLSVNFSSKKAYDLSTGFAFSFTQEILAHNESTYGNSSTIEVGDAIILKVIPGSSTNQNGKYEFTVNGNKEAFTFEGNSTLEGTSKINATFSIEFKDNTVSLYSSGFVSLSNTMGLVTSVALEDVSLLSSETIKVSSTWTHHSIGSPALLDNNKKVNSFSDISLDIGEASVHTHIFGEYVPNNDATCTLDGTKTATCTVGDCTKTVRVIDLGSAKGHNYVENTEGTAKVCSGCDSTIYLGGFDFEADFWKTSGTLSTTDGKSFSAPLYEKSGTSNQTDSGTATTKYLYDLSEGFRLTFTTNLTALGQNMWANEQKIFIGDAIELNITESRYKFTVDGKTVEFSIGSGATTDMMLARINATFSIDYRDGKVCLYSSGLVSTTNPTGIVTFKDGSTYLDLDSKKVEATSITFAKGWAVVTAEKGATTATVFSDILLQSIDDLIKVHPGVFEGVQEGEVDDTFSVRFIASIDSLNYTSVGFKVTAPEYNKSWTSDITTVYNKILGSTATGVTVEYTANDFGAAYLYALTIKGVPSEGEVTFYVTPYSKRETKSADGDTYIITYTDGVLTRMEKDVTVVLPPDAV